MGKLFVQVLENKDGVYPEEGELNEIVIPALMQTLSDKGYKAEITPFEMEEGVNHRTETPAIEGDTPGTRLEVPYQERLNKIRESFKEGTMSQYILRKWEEGESITKIAKDIGVDKSDVEDILKMMGKK